MSKENEDVKQEEKTVDESINSGESVEQTVNEEVSENPATNNETEDTKEPPKEVKYGDLPELESEKKSYEIEQKIKEFKKDLVRKHKEKQKEKESNKDNKETYTEATFEGVSTNPDVPINDTSFSSATPDSQNSGGKVEYINVPDNVEPKESINNIKEEFKKGLIGETKVDRAVSSENPAPKTYKKRGPKPKQKPQPKVQQKRKEPERDGMVVGRPNVTPDLSKGRKYRKLNDAQKMRRGEYKVWDNKGSDEVKGTDHSDISKRKFNKGK